LTRRPFPAHISPSVVFVSELIAITGIRDHHRLEHLIAIPGIRTPDAELLSEMIGFAAQRNVGSRGALPRSMIGVDLARCSSSPGLRPSVAERRSPFFGPPLVCRARPRGMLRSSRACCARRSLRCSRHCLFRSEGPFSPFVLFLFRMKLTSSEPPPNEWTPVVGSLSPEVSNGTSTSVIYRRVQAPGR